MSSRYRELVGCYFVSTYVEPAKKSHTNPCNFVTVILSDWSCPPPPDVSTRLFKQCIYVINVLLNDHWAIKDRESSHSEVLVKKMKKKKKSVRQRKEKNKNKERSFDEKSRSEKRRHIVGKVKHWKRKNKNSWYKRKRGGKASEKNPKVEREELEEREFVEAQFRFFKVGKTTPAKEFVTLMRSPDTW